MSNTSFQTSCTRRHFLSKTAQSGAGIMGVGLMSQMACSRSIGANDRINTAVIGLGGQGLLHFKYQTEENKNVRIAAICDIDKSRIRRAFKKVPGKHKAKTYVDYRKLLDDKDIDSVVIASPNHWHALQTVHACQAGKDVYVEKPATYCVSEGPKMIEAAKKYGRVVQVGTHKRANEGRQKAMRLIRDGLIGKVYEAEFNFFRARNSIGTKPNGPVPKGIDYDLWLGPAPKRPFNPNRFHYTWHWFWDYGGGELGNNGPHYIDFIIEGLDRQTEFPEKVACQGGRYVWNDQGETPNSATALYRYADGTRITFSILDQISKNGQRSESDRITFRGSKGILHVGMRGDFVTIVNNKPGPKGKAKKTTSHPQLASNFYDVMRSRKIEDLLSPPEYGHTVASLCHLGNIAYRCDKEITIDPVTQTIVGNEKASALLTRTYRKPYTMPEEV